MWKVCLADLVERVVDVVSSISEGSISESASVCVTLETVFL